MEGRLGASLGVRAIIEPLADRVFTAVERREREAQRLELVRQHEKAASRRSSGGG